MRRNKMFKKKLLIALVMPVILVFSGVFGITVQPAADLELDDLSELETQAVTGSCEEASRGPSDEQDMQEPTNSRSSSRATIDVGMAGISDVDAENYIDHYPGTVVHLNVSIRNFGTEDIETPFEILLHISAGTSYPPDYHYQDNRTLPGYLNRTVLNANTSYNLTWNWTPPLEMPHGCEFNFTETDITFTARFTTVLDNDEGSNNNQMSIDIKVEQPDFDVELEPGWWFRVGDSFSYEPQEDPVILTIISGQTNQFQLDFTLHNHGEATFINFSINAPTDWKAIPPARKFWQSKSNSSAPVPQNLSITVFPSTNLEYLPTASDLYISLKAVCESYPLAFDVLRFRVKVNFIPLPTIKPPKIGSGEVYYITPGVEYINFKVYNMGNGADNFKCTAQVGEAPGYFQKLYESQGWKAVVHSGAITRILKRTEYQIVIVKVWVPSTVRAGSPCPIKLTAESINGPYHEDSEKNTTFYIFADLFKDVSFEEESKSISMNPNDEASTITKIRNTGNKVDKSMEINVTSLPEDWEVTIDSSDIPAGGLPRNGTAEIEIIIATPKHVVEAKYDIKIAAMSDDKIRDEITINVQINKIRKILMNCKEPKQVGNVAEKISYLVTVQNLGNSKDSVDIKYSYITKNMQKMPWRVEMSKNFTTLYPYESRDVIVSVFIPLTAEADTNFLTPNPNGYLIKIIGISQNDTSVTDEKEIEAVVNPIYDFEFSKEKDKKYLILGHTQTVDYTFEISNKGNDMDWYNIDFEAPPDQDWISIPYTQRKLLPAVTEQLYLYFDPPAVLGVGEYIFNITAESAQKPSLTQSLELTIEIIDFDIALREIKIGEKSVEDADIKEGETVLLRAQLENVGDLDYFVKSFVDDKGNEIPLIIKFTESSNYIGQLNITYLPSLNNNQNNTAWVSLPWKIGKARDYELTVEVDPNEDIPESKRSNNKLTETLIVKGEEEEKKDEKVNIGGLEVSGEAEDVYMIFGLIIVFVIIMIIGIWMTIAITKRGKKEGYTADGEYKPYEESKAAEFDKDEEEEEEPEGGVLGIQAEHPYGTKKKDKFLTESLSFDTMKPIKKTKPIRKSKPLSSMVEGKPPGLEKPHIAGYLPPKSKSADTDSDKTASIKSSN